MGPIEVAIDGRPVDLGGPKAGTLLAALITNRPALISSESLIEHVWGEHPPATAAKSIQKYISHLRKAIGPGIRTAGRGYLLEIADHEVDAHRFEALLRSAEDQEPRKAETSIREAMSLWRGSPLPELADTDIGRLEAARLEDLRIEGEQALAESLMAQGRHRDVVADLEELVESHPFREPLWGLLMLALYRSGRQSDALEAYQRLRDSLGNELGIEPSPDVQELEEQILLQSQALQLEPGPQKKTNLPSNLTSFVGRSQEIADINDRLQRSRLVTLLGPAGSGKTRLATEAARGMDTRFADGIWFVDLAAVRSPDRVVGAISSVLGVANQAEADIDQVLEDFLAERSLMLLMDNCEHLVSSVATTVESLLRSTTSLVVLATSRERLGIPGEILIDVPPLPYPSAGAVIDGSEAIQLFVDRADSVGISVDLEVDGSVVADIVKRLDGMPLAIELAAARARGLGLPELATHLDDRFSVLTSPSRSSLDRHQTLQQAVDWSYQLLQEDEKTLFRRLSVFRGGFTLEAASRVCGFEPLDPEDVLDLLTELADKSLVGLGVEGHQPKRYFLLETLREFGQMSIPAPETGRLRASHAAYFCQMAELGSAQLHGPEQRTWLRRLASDHDNLLKAMQWAATTDLETAVRTAIAMTSFWDSVGPRAEGHHWLSRAVELSRSLTPALRVAALISASEILSSERADRPRQLAEEAVSQARQLGDQGLVAKALRSLAWAHALDGSSAESVLVGSEALEMFEELGDDWELAHCLERLGQSDYSRSEWSLSLLQRALSIYRNLGDRIREALVLYKIAEHQSTGLGDWEQALANAEEAKRICDEVGILHDGAHARLEYGKILRKVGRYEQAAAVLDEALIQLTKSGDERCSIRTLNAIGLTAVDTGDFETASGALVDSLRRGRLLETPTTSRAALVGMARLLEESGRVDDAVRLLAFVETDREQRSVVESEVVEQREAHLGDLRSSLGDAGFEAAWADGLALDLDRAIDLAIGSLAPG